ncbi:hypothetical protein NC651_011120 [Populus alba x Populus x berolinensis]|nr:hypothetical protein NC651_011120 [Populus alba x Populus x berolinensis]
MAKQLNLQLFSAESGYAWESAKLKVLVLEYTQNGSLKSIIRPLTFCWIKIVEQLEFWAFICRKNSLSSSSAFEGTIGYLAPGNLSFSTFFFFGIP